MATEVRAPAFVKPEKPDEDTFRANLASAEKEHAAVQAKLNAIKAKIDLAKPSNQDSPTAKKQQELRAQLSAIRQQQQGFKASRGSTLEKISALDAQLKSRIEQQKSARGRVSFKNVEEIDREIQRLEKQVDAGTMKLVDEKKNLAEISSLRKQRKGFAGFEDAQKGINDLKAQIAELKKGMDNPESKVLSDQYSAIQKELDTIKAEQDGAFKNLNALRDERTKIHAEQQKAYTAIKELKDAYYQGRKAFKQYEDEAYRIRRERQKAERDTYERERRKKVADKKLEEASMPAFTEEILTAEGLIRHFDPTYDFASIGLGKKTSESATFRAEIGRKVDDADIKGVKVLKKDDREDAYFVGTGGKKGKKGKKGGAAQAPADSGKFNLSFGVIEDLVKVKADPPATQADVPALVEKLAAKIVEWKKNQDAKTKENVAKAQAEIEKLEEEAAANNQGTTDAAKKVAQKNAGTNGHVSAEAELAQEKDAVVDAAEDLKKASIEDNE